MSRRSVIIIGLTRQARFLMLPLPYAMLTIGLAVLPFIWFKVMWWLLTFPIWWGTASRAGPIDCSCRWLAQNPSPPR